MLLQTKARHNKSGELFHVRGVKGSDEKVRLIKEGGKSKIITRATLNRNYFCSYEHFDFVDTFAVELSDLSDCNRVPRGGKYYCVDINMLVSYAHDYRTPRDVARFNLGNYFDSKEAADKYREELLTLVSAKGANDRCAAGSNYYFVEFNLCFVDSIDFQIPVKGYAEESKTADDALFSCGNYFKTEEEARTSKLYRMLSQVKDYRSLIGYK